MGIATGNPTWEDYPSTNTPITADSLNRIETAIDGKQDAGSYAAASHQHTMADLTDYTPPDPGGLKVYTSWAEVDAESEPTVGVLTTDDWAPAGLTNDGTRDGAFFITTQVLTFDDAWVWKRQELRVWGEASYAPVWRVRQFSDVGGPWGAWMDVTHASLPDALKMSLAKAENSVVDLNSGGYATYFDNPSAPYSVGTYITEWGWFTGFAELPDDYTTAHVFLGGTFSSPTQTVVVPLADGTSRTISRVSTDGTSYGAWTLQPTIPDSPDDIGAATAIHDHTAADIDSGEAADGHVLTADGEGGAAWEPAATTASHEALTIDGDTTLPSEHQVITLRVSSPATLSIADAPDGTVVTAHVAYGWEDITWAPEIVVQGETSTTETWLVLVRSEGQWKVLVSGGDGGGSIAGLNVITGSWPPPLPYWEYPLGTLFVRDQMEYDGPVMAVKKTYGDDWEALAIDRELSYGEIDYSVFTPVAGTAFDAGWVFDEKRSEGHMTVYAGTEQVPDVIPEPGDILCTYDPSALTGAQTDCLWAAMDAGVLTGLVLQGLYGEPLGIHHVSIDARDGVIKYLWPVAGAPLAYGDAIQLTWPVTIKSEHWEVAAGGGGVAT